MSKRDVVPFDLKASNNVFELLRESDKPFNLTRLPLSRAETIGHEALKTSLLDSLSTDAAERWLASPNAFLGGETPIQVLESGDLEAAEGAVEAFNAGYYI